MLEYWIWLATRQGLNKRKQYELLQRFGDPEAVYRSFAQAEDLQQAQQILNRCREQGIQLLTLEDPRYPQRLKGIYEPPLLLYYRGSLPDWEAKPVIGAVGTRRCSQYGLRCAHRMAQQLILCGATVVSGMAEGIDTGVLNGALAAGGAPAVFLAGGVDMIYPAGNRGLYQQILNCGGCILSEQPPGVGHAKWLFPLRNRLISGISNGLLVVEAPEKSGALITARHAIEQGRAVFAVPGPIDAQSCSGSNALLQEGARIAQSGWDLLRDYQDQFEGLSDRTESPGNILKNPVEMPLFQRKTSQYQPKVKKTIDKESKQLYSDLDKKPAAGTPQEQAIMDQLLSGPKLTDEVINDCALPKGEALAVMTLLEIKGAIRRLPGNLLALNE
jgi:DNA processing protein